MALLAKGSIEPGLQYSVEDQPGQRITWLSCDQVDAGGLGPYMEKSLGRRLVCDMPVRNATRRHGCKHLEGDLNIFLKLDSLPVLGELGMTA